VYKVLVVKPDGKRHSEDLKVEWKIILKSTLKKKDGQAWNVFIKLGIGTSGQCNEILVCNKYEFSHC
jgi:hypothetical protein